VGFGSDAWAGIKLKPQQFFDLYWGWNYPNNKIPLELAPFNYVHSCDKPYHLNDKGMMTQMTGRWFDPLRKVYLEARVEREDATYLIMDMMGDRNVKYEFEPWTERDFDVFKISEDKCYYIVRAAFLFMSIPPVSPLPPDLVQDLAHDFLRRYIEGFGGKAKFEEQIRRHMELVFDYDVLRPILDKWPDDSPKKLQPKK
jgi:hypothetical protein